MEEFYYHHSEKAVNIEKSADLELETGQMST
jgi:hypothetical protein